jgi:hypothetical protein
MIYNYLFTNVHVIFDVMSAFIAVVDIFPSIIHTLNTRRSYMLLMFVFYLLLRIKS